MSPAANPTAIDALPGAAGGGQDEDRGGRREGRHLPG